MRSATNVAIALSAGVLGVSACAPDGQGAPPEAQPPTSAPPTSTAPSTTREVPPQQRVRLGDLSPGQLCGLLSPEDVAALAFPVSDGQPREVGVDPRIPGCLFDADAEEERSVLLGAQPRGFAELGAEEVELDEDADADEDADVDETDTGDTSMTTEPGETGTDETSDVPDPGRAVSQTLRANGCTVYAAAGGATLQVAVTTAEADSEQCDTAQAVARYVLPALER